MPTSMMFVAIDSEMELSSSGKIVCSYYEGSTMGVACAHPTFKSWTVDSCSNRAIACMYTYR